MTLCKNRSSECITSFYHSQMIYLCCTKADSNKEIQSREAEMSLTSSSSLSAPALSGKGTHQATSMHCWEAKHNLKSCPENEWVLAQALTFS